MTSMTSDSEWPTESTSLNSEPRSCPGLNSNARSLSDGECSSGHGTANCPTESGQRSQENSKLYFTRRLRRKSGECSSMLLDDWNYPRQNWGEKITLWSRRFAQDGARMFA